MRCWLLVNQLCMSVSIPQQYNLSETLTCHILKFYSFFYKNTLHTMFRSTLTEGIFSFCAWLRFGYLDQKSCITFFAQWKCWIRYSKILKRIVLVFVNLSTVKNLPLFKESGEDVTVPKDAGVEPPAVSPVSAKRKKPGRRSSGIWRYFSDMSTGILAK